MFKFKDSWNINDNLILKILYSVDLTDEELVFFGIHCEIPCIFREFGQSISLR